MSTSVAVKPDERCRHRHVRAARDGRVARLHVDPVRARGLDVRHGHEHGQRALPEIGGADGEDGGGGDRDAAHHGSGTPETAPLEAAPQVGFLALLDRRFDEALEHRRRLAGGHRRVRRGSGVDRAQQQLLQRGLVLLEVERHLLIGHAARKRPDEEEPAEAGEHEVGDDARGDDGGGAEAKLLEAVRRHEHRADAGTQQHGQAAQHDLPAPPRPHAANRR